MNNKLRPWKHKVKIGTRFGRWRVVECFDKGPFAYVRLRCTCNAKSQRVYALGQIIRGVSLSCGCYRREFLAALQNERDRIRALYRL